MQDVLFFCYGISLIFKQSHPQCHAASCYAISKAHRQNFIKYFLYKNYFLCTKESLQKAKIFSYIASSPVFC
ncbi:hypothetical protein FAEPRAA2165_01576 [Faecalibacterium duncaniae]|uniref:Uncharacterized protein n=1 Tax=Faecalibacterium duncaniae (strain DSM 17677 / JCM 31915 / A2-165) TaxID=411483 RepID=C7H5K5_FAED2|nr:hypothetical protein FAEPRAA2165_01576 [Faecalibacterium duncaniae]